VLEPETSRAEHPARAARSRLTGVKSGRRPRPDPLVVRPPTLASRHAAARRRALARALACSWLAALTLLGSGCDRVVGFRLVDPPIDVGDAGPAVPSGEPEVALGFYAEQLLDKLRDGDACPIVHGLQGGTWTMPAVRTTGLPSPALVTCDVLTQAGELVGHVEAMQPFVLATDGWLEVQAFPVPIVHAPPGEALPIDDLYGAHATLTCSVEAGDRAASASVEVILVEG
jgi:hypothetical protein